jgi:hypothetical protein
MVYRRRSPGTRRKSAVLRVSRVRWWTSPVAAIRASGVFKPRRRSSPALSATLRSTINSSMPASRRRAAGTNSVAPAMSSVLVMTEYASRPLLGKRLTDSKWSMQTSVSTSRSATIPPSATMVPLVPTGDGFPDSFRGTKGGIKVVVVIDFEVGVERAPYHLRHGGVRSLGDLIDASTLFVGEIYLGSARHIQHALYSTMRCHGLR